jgi:hypothetical protein
MPLIRRAPPPPPPVITLAAAIRLLDSDSAELRRQAATLLGETPPGTEQARQAAVALAERLRGETEIEVREAVFLAFSQIGGAETAELVGSFLRTEDAALRNGALETLKRLGDAAIGAVDRLLRDPDPDVRLLTVEVMRSWPASLACPRLEVLLTEEKHINVCGVSVDIATAAGDARLLPALDLCRKRFAGQAFLEFAIDCATTALTPWSPSDGPGLAASVAPPLATNVPAKAAAKPKPVRRRGVKVPGA